MKIEDYPAKVAQAESYTALDVAIVLRKSRPTVNKLIDNNTISGHRNDSGLRERRVLHENLLNYLKTLEPGERLAAIGRIDGLKHEAFGATSDHAHTHSRES